MASKDWLRVPLAQVLTQVFDQVQVQDGVAYKQVTVRMHNKGLGLRQEVDGREIKTKRQFRIRAGQFVFSRIDARNGAMGLVPSELDGAIVSNDFPAFDIRTDRVDCDFFKYYVSTPAFLDACLAQSKGTSNRRRLKEPDFLEIEISLPPLAEQQRIVARVDALAARIAAAQELQAQAVEETEALAAAASLEFFSHVADSNPYRPIGEVFRYRSELIHPGDGTTGPVRFIGLQHVESHTGRRTGEDLFLAEELKGRKFRFSPGEVLYGYLRPYLNKVWIADCDGICSVDQYVIRPNTNIVQTEYLAHFMRSPLFLNQAIEKTHSLTLPRLHTSLLESIPIPVPPLPEQRLIVAHLDRVQARVDALKQLQAQAQAELDALLPSVLDKAFRGEL